MLVIIIMCIYSLTNFCELHTCACITTFLTRLPYTPSQNTLFPPTTPPLILNMCNSTIHKQLARVRARPSKSPRELDPYLVWKEGATPTPNKSYDLEQFLADQPEFTAEMPATFLHLVNPEGVEYRTTPPDETVDPPPDELPKVSGCG